MLLTVEHYATLLRLLFSLDRLSFASIQAALVSAFPRQEERARACCAALLLLEDSRALNTAQRLGTWFLLYVGWPVTAAVPEGNGKGSNSGSSSDSTSRSPVAAYLVAVAGDERRCAVERHLAQQLLRPGQVKQLLLGSGTPLDYALSYSLPLAGGPAVNSQQASEELAVLRQQLMPGLAGASTDRLLHERKQQLVAAVSGGGDAGTSALATIISPLPTNHTAAAGMLSFGHSLRRSSPGSVVSDSSSTPNTPSNKFGLPPMPPLKTGTTDLASHRLSMSGPPSSSLLASGSSHMPNGTAVGHHDGSHGSDAGNGTNGSSSRGASGGGAPVSEQKLTQVRELVERALTGPLMPAQQAVVLTALQEHPGILGSCGVGPLQLQALVEHTPGIAVELLLGLAGSPALQSYLAVLAQSEMSLHGMEVVNRLTNSMELPTDFLHLYITNCIHTCEATQDKYAQSRHVRLLCVFLQSLIRNRVIQIADLLHEVQSFCVNFSRIREAAKLFRLLKQIEAGGRGAGSDGPGSPTGPANGSGLEAMDSLSGQAAPAVASMLS